MNFEDKVKTLIETVEAPNIEKLLANRDLINEIADYCKTRRFFIKNESHIRKILGGLDALYLYNLMIAKIAKFPNKMLAHSVVIIYLPIIAESLSIKQESVAAETTEP